MRCWFESGFRCVCLLKCLSGLSCEVRFQICRSTYSSSRISKLKNILSISKANFRLILVFFFGGLLGASRQASAYWIAALHRLHKVSRAQIFCFTESIFRACTAWRRADCFSSRKAVSISHRLLYRLWISSMGYSDSGRFVMKYWNVPGEFEPDVAWIFTRRIENGCSPFASRQDLSFPRSG